MGIRRVHFQRNLTVDQLKKMAVALCVPIFYLASGCGSWAGNPKEPADTTASADGDSKVTLDIQGIDVEQSLVSLPLTVRGRSGTEIGILSLTEARVVLKEIKIKVNSSDGKSRQKFPGPYVVDLLTNQTTPELDEIKLDSGAYTSVELVMAKLEKDKKIDGFDDGDPIVERSILLTGNYQPQTGAGVAFEMSYDVDESFKIGLGDRQNEVQVSPEAATALIIEFQLTSWFDFSGSPLDFSDLDSGPITLAKDTEGEATKKVREAIKENIKDSAKFNHDRNHDGKISDQDAD
jgi:hypothetical protein